MPAYNEQATIKTAVERVLEQKRVSELIIIDDASTDGTWDIIKQFTDSRVIVKQHSKNLGKGAALATGLSVCSSDIIGIHDADLEYDPKTYASILKPFDDGHADVVYGSRFLGSGAHRCVYYWHYVGNRFLTTFSNMCSNINLTDMETCQKFFRRTCIQNIVLKEKRFGIEPEITAKLVHSKAKIYEVSIPYYGRTYEEGKKINWRDGVHAIYCIIKYNLLNKRKSKKTI